MHVQSHPVYSSVLLYALSPVLFNVYTVGKPAGRTHSFADDRLAYRTCRDKQVTADSVQEDIDRIGA